MTTNMSEIQFLHQVEQSEAMHAAFAQWWAQNKAAFLAWYPQALEWQVELLCWKRWKLGKILDKHNYDNQRTETRSAGSGAV